MIKCLCKENVQDRITGEDYVAGKEYPFTKERAEEVTNSRYFEYAKVVEEATMNLGKVGASVEQSEKGFEELGKTLKQEKTKKTVKKSAK